MYLILNLGPISLSNFVNKILPRIICGRMEDILPPIINQVFKRKNYSIKCVLTHELASYIGKKGKPSNILLKLDMAKEYDRVSLFFLIKY